MNPIVIGKRNSDRWGDFYSLDLRGSLHLAAAHTAISRSCSKSPTRPIATTNVARCSKLREGGTFGAEVDHWLPTIVNLGFSYRWRNRD